MPAGELEQLEHLCRYVTRPPIATQRLALAPEGRVVYGLKRHWRDGTSAVSFDPLTFIERLAALVPPPAHLQLTYHGVLAPGSAWRDQSRAQARAGPRRTLARGLRPQLADRAQHLRPLALVALNVGRVPAPRLRRRRADVPALRRPTPPHRGAHRPDRRAQDPRPPRTADRASTARASSLTRTVRLRLSRRPSPRRARSSPATRAGE